MDMRESHEISDVEEYEDSVKDRVYLGTLILGGLVGGVTVVVGVICCLIKVHTGEWPEWNF